MKHKICSPIPCKGCGKSIYSGTVFEISPGEDGLYLCISCYYSAKVLRSEQIPGLKQFDEIDTNE